MTAVTYDDITVQNDYNMLLSLNSQYHDNRIVLLVISFLGCDYNILIFMNFLYHSYCSS